MKIEEAAKLLSPEHPAALEKTLRFFDEEDPFNGTTVRGYICNEATHRYGAMVISHVDGYPLPPQVIYGTPKIKYPFDRQGKYTFPVTKEIRIYDKLDGTNICAFKYTGPGKKTYVSYKTRLMPFVGDRRNGRFFSLWSEMLERYQKISSLVRESGCHLSFELYGYRNHHLIKYKESLDTALLFYIDPSTAVLHPPRFYLDDLGLPIPTFEQIIDKPHDVVAYYRKIEEEKQAGLTEVDDGLEESEGSIWWFKGEDRWTPYKCKPADIKEIHFAVGGPNRVAILHAAQRARDEVEARLSAEDVEAMLLEDYSLEKVGKKSVAIAKVVEKINYEADLREEVLVTYNDLQRMNRLTFGLKIDKGTTMRKMSKHYSKAEMKSVYRFIAEKEGLL